MEQKLRQLAGMFGVETHYQGVDGQAHEASSDSLLAVLQTLGAPLSHLDEAASAIRAARNEQWQQLAEPVVVAWQGTTTDVLLRVPDSQAAGIVGCELVLEDGSRQTWKFNIADLPVTAAEQVDGIGYSARHLRLPDHLPPGYHQLTLEIARRNVQSLVIAAPETAYQGEEANAPREWGIFLPLYALRRTAKRHTGDLRDLQELMHWAGKQGAGYLETLPILAGDLSEDPGPYAPSSQCWWNEFYLDLTVIPEFSRLPEARAALERSGDRLPASELLARQVDYGLETQTHRAVLDMLAAAFFDDSSSRRTSFDQYRQQHPEVERYARFRAAQQTHGSDWRQWPSSLPQDLGSDAEIDPTAYRRHLFAQWNMDQQIQQLASCAQREGMAWYLDLPLGSSHTGYDVWRHQELFAAGVSIGAPPDAFFSQGQNWGVPPPNPKRLRESRYQYFIDVLHWQMRYAGILRLDHAMRFERLFWIPAGLSAEQGVYVRYPADELFAILTLESQRTHTRLIGENLGTVPDTLNQRFARHQIAGTYVLQFETDMHAAQLINPVPSASAARLNTHDMAPFAAFFAGLDIDERVELGLLDDLQAQDAYRERRQLRRCLADYLHQQAWLSEGTLDPELVLEAALSFLAASPARYLSVNLEDLWLETRPQNTPGTSTERPNWQRQAKYSLESFTQHPAVCRMLQRVDRLRKRAGSQARPSDTDDTVS